MQDLPSKEQIIAVVRDEPMVGSQLRRAMGITKHKKLAFKQLLADGQLRAVAAQCAIGKKETSRTIGREL